MKRYIKTAKDLAFDRERMRLQKQIEELQEEIRRYIIEIEAKEAIIKHGDELLAEAQAEIKILQKLLELPEEERKNIKRVMEIVEVIPTFVQSITDTLPSLVQHITNITPELIETYRETLTEETKMNHPIINDPITMVAEAFEALHPGAKYEVAYAPDIRDGNGTIVCSCITFPSEEDGPDAVPYILLNSQAGIEVAAEAFAQELAHVALGPDSLDHGPEYDEAVDQLAAKYKEIAEDRFPGTEWADAEGGADDEAE